MFILFLITHLLIQSVYAQTATPSASIVLTISPPVVKTTITPTSTSTPTLSITPTPTPTLTSTPISTPILTPTISITATPSATISATATPSVTPNTPTPVASSSSAIITSPTPTLTPIPVVKTITQLFAPDTVFPESFLKLEKDRSLYSSQEITPSAMRSLLLEAIVSLLLGLLLIFWDKVSVLVAQLTSRNHWEYISINE